MPELGAPAKRYLARVCWNSKNWVYPTGEAAKSEFVRDQPHHNQPYTVQSGFGHEEWLFNFQWILDGWKYAFLQPVGRSYKRLAGKTIDLILYTISPAPARERFYVGRLPACEVLTEDQAKATVEEFRHRGWLDEMLDQVKQVGGRVDGLLDPPTPTSLFNIRYRPTEAQLEDPLSPAGAEDYVRILKHYTIVPITPGREKIESQWAKRRGTQTPRPTGSRTRTGVSPGVVNLAHNQLQNRLFQLLKEEHRTAFVEMEPNFVDIRIDEGSQRTLIEVKSDPLARFALREGLGQLLEYAFVSEKSGHPASRLIVAAPGEMSPEDAAFLEHLRGARRLPIWYVCFRNETSQVDI